MIYVSMIVRSNEDGLLEIISEGTEIQLISRDLLRELVLAINHKLGEVRDLEQRYLEATSATVRASLDHITTIGELQTAAEEITRLRAAGDAMVQLICLNPNTPSQEDWDAAIATWQEARRG